MTAAVRQAVEAERGSRAETFLHAPPSAAVPSKRRTVVAIVVAVALIAAVAATISELNAASGGYAAAAYPSQTLDLGFPTTAPISQIYVHPGQHVMKGQVLASQIAPDLTASVSLDRSAVAADQGRVVELKQLVLKATGPSSAASSAETTAALAEIRAGQNLVDQANAEASDVTAANNAASAARQSLAEAVAVDDQLCPDNRPASAKISPAECASLAAGVARAQAQVANATMTAISLPAQAAELRANGERAMATGDAALASQQMTRATQSATSLESKLASAQQTLSAAQAVLVSDRAEALSAVLRAPAAGTIEQVSGSPGELAGPTGVRANDAPPLAHDPSSAPLLGGTSNQSLSDQPGSMVPVVSIRLGNGWQVLASVPESAITSVHVGQSGSFTFDTLGGVVLHCVVQSISSAPLTTGGDVSYEVALRVMGRAPTGALPGMSGSLSLG